MVTVKPSFRGACGARRETAASATRIHLKIVPIWSSSQTRAIFSCGNPCRLTRTQYGHGRPASACAAENVMVTVKMTITDAFGHRHMALQRWDWARRAVPGFDPSVLADADADEPRCATLPETLTFPTALDHPRVRGQRGHT